MRRLGYLLELAGHERQASALHPFVLKTTSVKPLDPSVNVLSEALRALHQKNSKWKLEINVPVELTHDSAGVLAGMERIRSMAGSSADKQDLIICRAPCDLFSAPRLRGKIAFRGGTAINKLLFEQPLRYSEDIDLVQTHPEAIGETVDAVRECLAWLGKCGRSQAGHSMHLVFRFTPEAQSGSELKLKIEINTREHTSLYGLRQYSMRVESGWYRGNVDVASFEAEELFGTKLRALLQRRKNRDLFDLNQGLQQLEMDRAKIIASFDHYLALEGNPISRAAAEQRSWKSFHTTSRKMSSRCSAPASDMSQGMPLLRSITSGRNSSVDFRAIPGSSRSGL